MAPQPRTLAERVQEEDSTLMLNDFVSLPIIISDYDAVQITSQQTVYSTVSRSTTAPATKCPSDGSSDSAPRARWHTGFSDFADALYSRMSGSMRAKLREACVEVLRRTDDSTPNSSEARWGDRDDNTRLLD